MTQKLNVDDLLSRLMQGADLNYRQKIKMEGAAFIMGPHLEKPALITSTRPITSLDSLRRFAASIRKAVRQTGGSAAGVLCELNISLDEEPPEPSVLLYCDQKFANMRVFVAPKKGDSLVFRDLGIVRLVEHFLPNLIPIEAYGPVVAEA